MSALLLTGLLVALGHVQPEPLPGLTRANVARVRGGMTLSEVLTVLGPRAEINPNPPPFARAPGEVMVVWRAGPAKWVGVVFVADKARVLRVLDTGETNIDFEGL